MGTSENSPVPILLALFPSNFSENTRQYTKYSLYFLVHLTKKI